MNKFIINLDKLKKLTGFKHRVIALSLPAFTGFILFFVFPAGRSVYFSMVDNTHLKNFVFIDNYIEILKNRLFQLALFNTLIFSIIGVVLVLTISLLLAFALIKITEKHKFIKRFFVLPMLLPTASIIAAWRLFFDNDWYHEFINKGDFYAVFPIYLLYIWKNTGINLIIITAAASKLPNDIFEAAALEGAKGFTLFRKITFPCIIPSIFFTGVLSFVNSLKIFKESYLFFNTNYPPDAAYILQYYMNNHFQKLNYQILASATVIFTIIISIVIIIIYVLENKFTKDMY